jgi:P-type E1-E2 ATPase
MLIKDKRANKILKYELLHVIEFNSDRKRMSVIVRDPEGQVVLMCKGADSIIAERLSQASKQSPEYQATGPIVDEYANEGLRTLYLAERIIPKNVYDEWDKRA